MFFLVKQTYLFIILSIQRNEYAFIKAKYNSISLKICMIKVSIGTYTIIP